MHDLTGIITGHNSLNYHQYHLGNVDSPKCRLCEDELETAAHLITDCLALMCRIQTEVGICPIKLQDLQVTNLKTIYKIWCLV